MLIMEVNDKTINKIRDSVTRRKQGSVIFVDSFDGNEEYIGKILQRMVQEGKLVRLSRGIYLKPTVTRFGILYPPVDELVNIIARRDHADVLPAGNVAINRLGLSTQVPMTYEFITTGSARKLILGTRTVILKRGVPRNFAYKGKTTRILIQALKAIGQDNVTPEMKNQIRTLYKGSPETDTLKKDLAIAPRWMKELIMPLAQ